LLIIQDVVGLDVPVANATVGQVVEGTEHLLEDLHAEVVVIAALLLALSDEVLETPRPQRHKNLGKAGVELGGPQALDDVFLLRR
jgi:hypothetical protein